MNEGETFGELALISVDGVRAARITTAGKDLTKFGVLSHDDYNKCLRKIDKQRQLEQQEFIKNIPYFKSLTRASLVKLVRSFYHQRFNPGQEVTTESFEQHEVNRVVEPMHK